MDRAEFVKHMHAMTEIMYDIYAPGFPEAFGTYANDSQLAFIRKLLERLPAKAMVLSAACGAGRYDGLLLAAGHRVTGTDLSAGMLEVARRLYPTVHYEKVALQEMDFHEMFDGAICMDAMEHICPEDWTPILSRFADALKPGGWLYFNPDPLELYQTAELQAPFERAQALGLPVIFGEVADNVEASYVQLLKHEPGVPFQTGDAEDSSVYHYHPPVAQIHAWVEGAGFSIQETAFGDEYYHVLAKKL